MRLLNALLFAPLPAILLFLAMLFAPAVSEIGTGKYPTPTFRSQLILFSIGAFTTAYGVVFLVAAPLFIALRRYAKVNLLISILAGAVIGALLVLGPEIFRVLTIREGSTLSSGSGGCRAIVENVRTACGYMQLFKEAGLFAFFGAISAAFFWHVYAHPNFYKFHHAIAALGLVGGGIAAIALLTADRTCHNLSRYDKSSFHPWLAVELDITEEDWPSLIDLMSNHAEQNGLSFQDYSHNTPNTVNVLSVSVCDGVGYYVDVNEQRWKTERAQRSFTRSEVQVHFTEVIDGKRDLDLARALISDLKEAWPQDVYYIGEGQYGNERVETEAEAIRPPQ